MMKSHMIARVRREAGLPPMSSSVDIPVKFYTLEAESTNNRIKTKKQRKASGFMGTIEAIRSIDEEQKEDFALAVAGLHEDFKLRTEFAKFKRPDFLELSTREREKYISKLRNTDVGELLRENLSSLLCDTSTSTVSASKAVSVSTITQPSVQVAPDKDDTLTNLSITDKDERLCNLPPFTREGILRKADRMLRNEQVYEGPSSGGAQWYSVASFSCDKPHQVSVKGGNGEVCCDCKAWKAQKCCAHALAVAETKGMLSDYLDWCAKKTQRNVTSVVNMNVRKQALGRKAKDKLPRNRKRKEPPTVLAQTKQPRKSLPKDRSEHYKYRLIFLSESTAYKCYGCDSAMRCPPAVPDSLNNMALTTMEHRSFMLDGKMQVKFQRTYYHVSRACIQSKNGSFTTDAILLEEQSRLDDKQKHLLEREFDLQFE